MLKNIFSVVNLYDIVFGLPNFYMYLIVLNNCLIVDLNLMHTFQSYKPTLRKQPICLYFLLSETLL